MDHEIQKYKPRIRKNYLQDKIHMQNCEHTKG